jgi:replicative DNA helicase
MTPTNKTPTLCAPQVWEGRRRLPTITTFSKKLNAIFGGGFRATGVYVCTGGPGAGKSNTAVAMAEASIEADCPVIYVSAELTPQLVLARLIGRKLGLEWLDVLDTEDSEKLAAMQEIVDKVGQLLWIVDSKQCGNYDDRIRQIHNGFLESKREQYRQEHEGQSIPKEEDFVQILVIVDYIQDLAAARVEEYDNPRTATTAESRKLRALADELFIPILVISSSARSFYSANDEQKNEDLIASAKESGAVEYDSAAVFHIRRRDAGETKAIELIVAKNRFGASMQTIVFTFEPATGRMTETNESADQLKYKTLLDTVGKLIYHNPGKYKDIVSIAKELNVKASEVKQVKNVLEQGLYGKVKWVTNADGCYYMLESVN